mmetsp:Transcript_33122/g.83521  ORF Transcript_33122/g.83521 Transcript_33122/m.83521 type:complete len:204 (+) Transcript_33122:592-1203(+)
MWPHTCLLRGYGLSTTAPAAVRRRSVNLPAPGRSPSFQTPMLTDAACFRCLHSDGEKQPQQPLEVPDDLCSSKLRRPPHPVHEGYWHLRHSHPGFAAPHDDFHLKHVPLRHHLLDQVLEHGLAVEAVRAGQVRYPRIQQNVRQVVGHPRRQLPPRVPAVYAAPGDVARPRHDVKVPLALLGDELWDRLRVVTHVRVHDENELA